MSRPTPAQARVDEERSRSDGESHEDHAPSPTSSRPDLAFIDVRELLAEVGCDSDPHLVTRPIGQAVRYLIEARLAGLSPQTVCVIDLRGVVVLDFSGADEVAARVKARATNLLLVFRCAAASHAEQLGTVLSDHALAAVAETDAGTFQLLGEVQATHHGAWRELERLGSLCLAADGHPPASSLDSLAEAGLAFKCDVSGTYHALSTLLPTARR